MSKLYALTVLLLAQSVCAMESEQPQRLDTRYFDEHAAQQLTPEEFALRMDFWANDYGKVHLDWSDEYIRDNKSKNFNKQLVVLGTAQECNRFLKTIKLNLSDMLSTKGVEPLLSKLASSVPVVQGLPVQVREISMPLSCFLVGFGVELTELNLGHALFNICIKRDAEALTEQKLAKALSVGLRDLQVATAVSVLKIAVDKGLHATGGHARLESIERYLQERFPRLKRGSWLYAAAERVARAYVYRGVERALYGPDRSYVKYLNYTELSFWDAMKLDKLNSQKPQPTLDGYL